MAMRLGVSRAPVREALRQLEQEGLVDFTPHRGATVIGVPDAEIDALYELRAVVEAKAIARACTRMTEADFAVLKTSVAGMNEAIARHDMVEVARHDMEFHRLILEVSGFSLLKQLWSSVDGLVRLRSYQALGGRGRVARGAVRGLVASHEQLIEALRKGNATRAAALVRQHIMDVPARRQHDAAAKAE
jgi:DNA-binding GntR family transcriptional regulator